MDGGRYIYTEMSWPRTVGQRTRIASPAVRCTVDGSPLIQFWYHMWGQSTGTLSVYLRRRGDESGAETIVWRETGDRGNRWRLAHTYVPDHFRSNVTFQVSARDPGSSLGVYHFSKSIIVKKPGSN